MSARAAARAINRVHGPKTVSQSTAISWYSKFKEGNFDIIRKYHGREKTFTDGDLIQLVDENPHMSLKEMGDFFDVSSPCIYQRLSKLKYSCKKSAWVPHQLTEANKRVRYEICLENYRLNEECSMVEDIVTCDEKWVFYQNPKMRTEWSPVGAIPQNVPKRELHPQKKLISIWYDCRGIIYKEALPMNMTIDGEYYANQLDRVNRALAEKRPALFNRGRIIYLHDNARPHTSIVAKKKLEDLEWKVLRHPPYSPDISPCDYHLFRAMNNECLSGKSFKNWDELKVELSAFLNSKSEDFYYQAFKKLPELWKEVVENNGDYLRQ